MKYKHSSTVTGTDSRFSESHIHQPFICQVSKQMKKRVVWNFRHWSKKKTVIIQALSLCTIRDISSALERSGSTLRKHLACSSQGRSERTARLPRVDGYRSCLLSLIQRAHLQPYRAICRVSVFEYILAYLHIYIFKYTLVLFRIWMCTYIYMHAHKDFAHNSTSH